jgi:alkaline phosphatase
VSASSRRPSFSTALLAIILCALLAVAIASRFTRIDIRISSLAISVHRAPGQAFPVPDEITIRNPGPTRRFHVPATPGPPRNVVLVIGDGMGLGHLSVVSTLVHGPAGGLSVESAPVVGLVRTWAANDLVTGSAASASAIATGLKADRRAISVQPDGSRPPTLFELAAAHGKATGVVTTSGLVDATPAAFITHASSRYDYRLILEGMLESSADVLIGGDFTRHRRARRQSDYLELAADLENRAPARWTVVRDPTALDTAAAPTLALFPPRPGYSYAHGPMLARSASIAIDRLQSNPLGFLLLLECEEPDEGAHDNDLDRVVDGVQELDSAVAEVLEFASRRADTLVVITADHDTGSPTIVDGEFDPALAEIRWLSDDHTAAWVPLFAYGPGADRFAGVYDNTELGRRIAELLGLDELPAPTGTPGAG